MWWCVPWPWNSPVAAVTLRLSWKHQASERVSGRGRKAGKDEMRICVCSSHAESVISSGQHPHETYSECHSFCTFNHAWNCFQKDACAERERRKKKHDNKLNSSLLTLNLQGSNKTLRSIIDAVHTSVVFWSQLWASLMWCSHLHEELDILLLSQKVFIERAPLRHQVQYLPLPVEGLLPFLLTPTALRTVGETKLKTNNNTNESLDQLQWTTNEWKGMSHNG